MKVKASEEGFEELYLLVDTLAKYKNRHLFFDLRDASDLEIAVEISCLEALIKEHIDVGEL